jgi:hypothetical protein
MVACNGLEPRKERRGEVDPLVHDIRDVPQSVVDKAMIAVSAGLERRANSLVKHGTEPVLRCTEPYEGAFVAPVSVLFDEASGLWRMCGTPRSASARARWGPA